MARQDGKPIRVSGKRGKMKQLILAVLAVALGIVTLLEQSPTQAIAQPSPLGLSPQFAIVGNAEALTLTCSPGTYIVIQVVDQVRAYVSCQAGALTVLDPVMAVQPITEDAVGVGRGAVPVGDMALPTATPYLMRWER